MIETSPAWFDWVFFLVPAAISIWLLIQGFVNIKTGKATRFGLDALDYWIEKRFMRKSSYKSYWDNPKRIRLSGALTIMGGLAFGVSAIQMFNQGILPYMR